jgi:prepilin-type N-terminal cleavage/methylation domain-containing protein
MDRLRNLRRQQGFTLIEMAIVLVIIGLIIGAVLKGQDLIQNARAKKFTSFMRAAEVGQWNYLDRKGHFNGDSSPYDGLIDETNATYTWTGFDNPPEDSITLGSDSFDLYYGSNGTANYIAATPNSSFGSDNLVFAETFDAAIDGEADGSEGNVVCVSTAISSNGNGTGSLSGSPAACDGAGSLVYFFD